MRRRGIGRVGANLYLSCSHPLVLSVVIHLRLGGRCLANRGRRNAADMMALQPGADMGRRMDFVVTDFIYISLTDSLTDGFAPNGGSVPFSEAPQSATDAARLIDRAGSGSGFAVLARGSSSAPQECITATLPVDAVPGQGGAGILWLQVGPGLGCRGGREKHPTVAARGFACELFENLAK